MNRRLDSSRFRGAREEDWYRFHRLVTMMEAGGPKSLSAADLADLPGLHHEVLGALAVAREHVLDEGLVRFLDQLAARGHLALQMTREPRLRGLLRLVTGELPVAFRAALPSFLVALLALLVGVAAGRTVVGAEVVHHGVFIDGTMLAGRGPFASAEALEASLFEFHGDLADLRSFALQLWAHNVLVTLFAFVLCALFAGPGLLILFANGAMLGAFTALFAHRDLELALWGWLLPHGITEFLAILFGATAGLELVRGVVFPGERTRLGALEAGGRRAGTLLLGSMALLLLAALLEAFFRQLVTSTPARFAIAGATLAFWAAFLGLAGRGAKKP